MNYNENKQQIKIEYDEGLNSYFKTLNLKKYKPLKRNEERELLEKYKNNNDFIARQKIIMSNLRYACKLVDKYKDYGLSVSDLIEEANCGLIEAIERYDMNYDVKVITYATWYIERKMQEAIKDKNKIPVTDLPDYETDNITDNDDMTTDDNYSDSYDTLDEIQDNYSNVSYDEILKKALNDLTEKERDLIEMYYGLGKYSESHTYEEIGKKYKVTKERIRKIIEKTMRKLRVFVLKNE